jgi:hypothetical protein
MGTSTFERSTSIRPAPRHGRMLRIVWSWSRPPGAASAEREVGPMTFLCRQFDFHDLVTSDVHYFENLSLAVDC